jgi:hypothetical protein
MKISNGNSLENKEKEELLLLAEYQLRLNRWKQRVAEFEKELEEKLLLESLKQ